MVRKRSLQSVICTILVSLLLTLPMLPSLAAAADEDACAAGQASAAANTNGGLWFLAGCVGSWIGLLCAYMVTPNPPASALVGKSPEYVAKYTDCYREKAKGRQTSMAWTGCGVITGLYVIATVIAVAAAANTVNDTPSYVYY